MGRIPPPGPSHYSRGKLNGYGFTLFAFIVGCATLVWAVIYYAV